MTKHNDHFSKIAASYAAARPTYPVALAEFLRAQCAGGAVLDVACGNGQLTEVLAGCFTEVSGIDMSAEQIAQATPHGHVRYWQASAYETGMADASVDMVTVAQAAHWFDLPRFYAEMRRIVKPGGRLALICYDIFHTTPGIDRMVHGFYRDVLGPYWPKERWLVDAGYQSIAFPFAELPSPPFQINARWSANQVLGYIETWSALRMLEKANKMDLYESWRSEFLRAWHEGTNHAAAQQFDAKHEEQLMRDISWPIIMRLAKVHDEA